MDLSSALSTVASSSLTEKAASLLLAGQGRTIMGLFADVTIEEKHKDTVRSTDHPTEVGSPISDHAYKEPAKLNLKVGWSESAGHLNGFVGDSILSETLGLVAVYEILQTLQDSFTLLIISTGKRLYTNMLIEDLSCTTDVDTEHVLMIEMQLKYIKRVNAVETTILMENQSDPASTAQVQNAGTVQKEEVSTSILGPIFGDAQIGGSWTLSNPFN